MKKYLWKMCTVTFVLALLVAAMPDSDANARAGGGRSSGSRGSRSYSPPSRSYSQPAAPRRDVYPSAPAPMQRPAPSTSGGFMRSFAGGMLGGLVGGMLFRSLGFGGGYGGGFGGSGIGLFEILLIAGIGYFIYRMVMKKRNEGAAYQQYEQPDYRQPTVISPPAWQPEPEQEDVATGLSHIRQMDYSFDEARFKDQVMDIFFKIQGAWMNRNLSSVSSLLTDDMRRTFQEDIDRLLREKRINKLENIAVRNVDITEAWQESGQDFITTLIYANLLDYTVDDSNGAVVAGSNVEPVKFEEYWTFARPVGNNPWKLSAIDQK